MRYYNVYSVLEMELGFSKLGDHRHYGIPVRQTTEKRQATLIHLFRKWNECSSNLRIHKNNDQHAESVT